LASPTPPLRISGAQYSISDMLVLIFLLVKLEAFSNPYILTRKSDLSFEAKVMLCGLMPL
jgi:hypothetical protein